jgi:hypothetical protein
MLTLCWTIFARFSYICNSAHAVQKAKVHFNMKLSTWSLELGSFDGSIFEKIMTHLFAVEKLIPKNWNRSVLGPQS